MVVMKDKIYFSLTIIMLAVMAYILQSMIFLNSDVASLLFDTKLFLNGGTYINDFFETNPPMIFIIYSPAVIAASLFSINAESLINLYIIFLGLFSLMCCSSLVKQAIHDDYRLRYAFIFALAFVFFLLPVRDFGQREHVLVFFMMPYLLSVILRAQNKPISFLFSCLIGFLAGIVFALKPYFLPALILFEIYLMYIKRNLFAWLRIESLVCGSTLIAYLVYVYLLHPSYFEIMLPLLSHFYFPSIKQSWLIILTKPTVVFCLLTIAYYFGFYKKSYYQAFTQVLLLGLLGMILAFVLPRAAWGYHVYPAVALSSLLITFFIFQGFSKQIHAGLLLKREAVFLVMAGFVFPLYLFFMGAQMELSLKRNSAYSYLVETLKQLPEQSVYCFSSHTTGYCFPMASVVNKQFAGRPPFFWWIRGLYNKEHAGQLTGKLLDEKELLIQSIADDLNNHRPGLIIMNEVDEKYSVAKGFTYAGYFSQNESFREAWKHYRFLTKVDTFVIYQRIRS